jgi:hypothetical protein
VVPPWPLLRRSRCRSILFTRLGRSYLWLISMILLRYRYRLIDPQVWASFLLVSVALPDPWLRAMKPSVINRLSRTCKCSDFTDISTVKEIFTASAYLCTGWIFWHANCLGFFSQPIFLLVQPVFAYIFSQILLNSRL